MNHPLMQDLPSVLSTEGWEWRRFESPTHICKVFWVGTDRLGQRWLTKLRGDFSAYREFVFGRIAQSLGWSHQSSVFLEFDALSAQTLDIGAGEVHAGHWFLSEHSSKPCSSQCPLKHPFNNSVRRIEDLDQFGVSNIYDWPKTDFATLLFGASEPSDRLLTTDHELVMIDSELTFSIMPHNVEQAYWWGSEDDPNKRAVSLTLEVCREVVCFGIDRLKELLVLPPKLQITQEWDLDPILQAGFDYAAKLVSSNS